MTAKLDMTVTTALFEERFGRPPRPTEAVEMITVQAATLLLCPADDYAQLWDRVMGDLKAAREVSAPEWDEFATIGCLDSGI